MTETHAGGLVVAAGLLLVKGNLAGSIDCRKIVETGGLLGFVAELGGLLKMLVDGVQMQVELVLLLADDSLGLCEADAVPQFELGEALGDLCLGDLLTL